MVEEEKYAKPVMYSLVRFSDDNEDKLYKVQRILDCKLSTNGRKFYLVKWAGWPIKYSTWQPHENVSHLKHLTAKFRTEDKSGRVRKNVVTTFLEDLNKGDSSYKMTEVIGHFLYGDKPSKIESITKSNPLNAPQTTPFKHVVVQVSWHERSDGKKPRNTKFQIEQVMEYAPEFLFESLERLVILEPNP